MTTPELVVKAVVIGAGVITLLWLVPTLIVEAAVRIHRLWRRWRTAKRTEAEITQQIIGLESQLAGYDVVIADLEERQEPELDEIISLLKLERGRLRCDLLTRVTELLGGYDNEF